MIGESPQLMEVLNAASLVAAADVNVLITGETGTGKELLARTLHQASPRAERPFVTLNCASLSETLADSLLFGHRRGAFTDARQDHDGYVSQAADGTLFLDELAELPQAVQAKLLRFLESGEYQPLGGMELKRSRTRVVAATNCNLSEAVQRGEFRKDLYYRLNVVPLHLPALRERTDDVPRLIHAFMRELAVKHGVSCPTVKAAAMRTLLAYSWPGNVRELRNLCERLVILRQGQDIDHENLPLDVREETAVEKSTSGGFRLPIGGIDLAELEQNLIHQALELTGGNRSRAARMLGLTRDTFLYRMKKYGEVL